MSFSIRMLVTCGSAAFLMISCQTTKTIDAKVTVLKQSGGAAKVVASSYNEAFAYDGAKERAEEFCFKKKMDYIVDNEESKYQGADKTASGMANAVASIFKSKSSSKNLDDYKVTMTIKCEGKYTGKGAPFAETLDLSRSRASW